MTIQKCFEVRGSRESRFPSYGYDFSNNEETRIIEVFCSDKLKTNDFVIVRITRDYEDECYEEMFGQWTDGIFENEVCERPIEIDPAIVKGITVPMNAE